MSDEDAYDTPYTPEIEQLLRDGEQALQNALTIEAENPEFNIYLQLGNLYWEWHFWLGTEELCSEAVKKAINAWEEAQKLTRNVRLPRAQRTIREDMEILIASAMKKLKTLAYD